jgi:PAS domain S-box-containing protein
LKERDEPIETATAWLADVEARYRAVADFAPVMIWMTGTDGDRQFFNAGWLDFTGRSLTAELGRGWESGLHPDDRVQVIADDQDAFRRRIPIEHEYRLRRHDGVYRWILARGVPYNASDGTFAGSVGAAIDVTERRRIEAERTRLLSEANEANARLAQLQDVTARLGRVSYPADVADVVLGQGVAELGGHTGSLCLLTGDGTHFQIVAQVGYPDDVTSSWGKFPLSALTPVGDAFRTGEAVYLSSLEELHARYPVFRGQPIVGDEALAVLPLTTPGPGTLGAMAIGFATARDFTPADRRFLVALAAQAATALARTQAHVATDAARREAEAAGEQLTYLAEASARLSGSLDLDATLRVVAQLAVPRLADRCALFLLAGQQVEPVILAPPEMDPVTRALLERYPANLSDPWGVGAVLRTGHAEFMPTIDEAMLAEAAFTAEHHDLLRRIGFGAALILPLHARGRRLGALVLTNRVARPMADAERVLAEELAARAAVAVDNARLFISQSRVAHQLQASLLPPKLPVIAGLDLAAYYAPVGEGLEVGGDFYDIVQADDGSWLLVVGDVKGRGIDAAAVTGVARHTIRSAALRTSGPAALLEHLNQVLIRHEAERSDGTDKAWDEPSFCSVVIVRLRREGAAFRATVGSAGHPLPLLRRADGTVSTIGRPGGLLGIGDSVLLPETTVDLPADSTVVCFTDGVTDCHVGRRFFDEEGIASVLASSPGSARMVADRVESATRTFAGQEPVRDDMAILVVRVL